MNVKIIVGLSGVAIILAAASIMYYFFEVRPDIERNKIALENKERCFEAGSAAAEKYAKEWEGEHFISTPEFHYNEKLNTCLWSREWIWVGTGVIIEHHYVTDVYSNSDLLESIVQNYTGESPVVVSGSSASEFRQAKDVLFSE